MAPDDIESIPLPKGNEQQNNGGKNPKIAWGEEKKDIFSTYLETITKDMEKEKKFKIFTGELDNDPELKKTVTEYIEDQVEKLKSEKSKSEKSKVQNPCLTNLIFNPHSKNYFGLAIEAQNYMMEKKNFKLLQQVGGILNAVSLVDAGVFKEINELVVEYNGKFQELKTKDNFSSHFKEFEREANSTLADIIKKADELFENKQDIIAKSDNHENLLDSLKEFYSVKYEVMGPLQMMIDSVAIENAFNEKTIDGYALKQDSENNSYYKLNALYNMSFSKEKPSKSNLFQFCQKFFYPSQDNKRFLIFCQSLKINGAKDVDFEIRGLEGDSKKVKLQEILKLFEGISRDELVLKAVSIGYSDQKNNSVKNALRYRTSVLEYCNKEIASIYLEELKELAGKLKGAINDAQSPSDLLNDMLHKNVG